MKDIATIFKSLHLNYSTEYEGDEESTTTIQYINNPDGTVRWIWPSQLQEPLFLKFYSTTSYKSRVIALMMRIVFMLRLQKLVFKTTSASIRPTSKSSLINHKESNWAIFTGTPGPNRKTIVYKTSETDNSFLKVALNKKSESIIKNEAETLIKLKDYNPKSFVYPTIVQYASDYIEITDISTDGERSTSLTSLHIKALQELNELSTHSATLEDLPFWNQLKSDIEDIKSRNDDRIPNGLIRKTSFLLDSINDSAIIESCSCHGDFTPWNMFATSDNLHIYDWELYKEHMPYGFDAFHFIIQKGILIDRNPWIEIKKEIDTSFKNRSLSTLSNGKTIDKNLYLKLYLASNIILSLKVFLEQEEWHEQIHWSLKTWNTAVSSMLSKLVNHRSLLLMDTFDFLLHKPYAAIKFPNSHPEQLNEFSDVDLCLEQPTSIELCTYLNTHPLVLKYKMIRKSYMTVLELICHDGSALSVDLIWELKRKSTVLMDTQPLVQKAKFNDYQVRIPLTKNLGRFISLFYLSNQQAIPPKYRKITSTLKSSTNEIDQKLYKIATDSQINTTTLTKLLNQNWRNRGVQKIKNRILYLIDTIKDAVSRPGMIITFSGVDGAGKSTIIENVKHNIEKKLRRRVVVIRHRPSILPILSAWTKGKAVAESEAAQNLPRQGQNSSTSSSLLRFSYYYTDYIIGQFVIYFKYKLRGYVVLYDRYYFDFINDSKRSNIELPSFITKMGYKLLLKPNLNFFLYADSKLILSRKKELDAQTIDHLTHNYKTLFKELNDKENHNRYVSIENIDLNTTLSTIVNRIANPKCYAL